MSDCESVEDEISEKELQKIKERKIMEDDQNIMK